MVSELQATNLAKRVISTFFTAKGYPQLRTVITRGKLDQLHEGLLVLSGQFPNG